MHSVRRSSSNWVPFFLAATLGGCTHGTRDDEVGTVGPHGDQPDDGATEGDGQDGGDDDSKFDVAGGAGSGGGDEVDDGCQKVDFLFVIDNSGSMADQQQNLVNTFPGFISTIEETLQAQDFHIMVVDTDEESLSFGSLHCMNGECTCSPVPQCCLGMCYGGGIAPQPTECDGKPCSEYELPTGCDVVLGAGKAVDVAQNDCGILDGRRYMVDGQPNLTETFECVALVGAGGDGNERPMEAMMEAVDTLNESGECNEGFLRKDAILVVTFITDEEDVGKSVGDPAAWRQALVDAKTGDEKAVVVLGLVGDTDLPDGLCEPYDGMGNGAEPAPVLRQFAGSFEHGQWGSVCEPDYAPFFAEAVSVIDAACDEFVPPG
jgi:hypothetical protein